MKNKRIWVLILLGIVMLLLLSMPFLITLFFFPAYRSVGLGIMMLLVSALQGYAGTKSRQMARRSGASLLPWWKDYLVVIALMFGFFGLLECLVGLSMNVTFVHDATESIPGGIFFGLIIVLTLGVGIYGIILTVLHITAIKPPKRAE